MIEMLPKHKHYFKCQRLFTDEYLNGGGALSSFGIFKYKKRFLLIAVKQVTQSVELRAWRKKCDHKDYKGQVPK